MDLGLAGSRVIVTGGASNIGRGIVHAFAREGARVAIADIDSAQAQRVSIEAKELGAQDVRVVVGDLTRPTSARLAAQEIATSWGGIDALVNNAGWSKGEFLAKDNDRARWQRLVEINLFAAVDMSREVVAHMKETGGSVVFVASEAAFGQIRQGVYGATKAAEVALARTLAREHGRHGIRSNVVCPGLVVPESEDAVGRDSLWAAGSDGVFNESQIDYLLKDTPLQRLTTADDVANAVVWLSSPVAARQVTGQLIAVSGGYTMP